MGRTWMEDWPGQFYVAKVARTLGHALSAGLAFKVSVDGTHAGIHQATELWFMCSLIHDLWMLNLGYGIGFLRDRRTISGLGQEKAGKRLARFPPEKGCQIGLP